MFVSLSKFPLLLFPIFCIFVKNIFKSLKSHIIFRNLLLSVVIALLIWQCANPVSPTGGPKDIIPPEVVKSEPSNFSLGFDKKRITITFDEYVSLKNPNQQIIISPPLAEKPEYKLRGKSVIIDLKAPLDANTTYSFFFGNSIVDIAEANPLRGYLYVLSTGDQLDSLAIAGEVLSAFNLQPEEDVFVMLYPLNNDTVPLDSLPYLVRPLYVAKTGTNGIFQLRYLRDEPYKIFALKDVDNNYRFNLPNEEIAFLDSLILPESITPPQTDTIAIDSLLSEVIDKDSLFVRQSYHQYYHLLMFQEIDSTQRLLDETVLPPAKFLLTFKFPTKDPKYRVVNREMPDDWRFEEINKTRDSIMVWVKNLELDSLQLEVADGDSILDTVMIVFKKKIKEDKKRNRKKDKEAGPKRLKFRGNAKSGSMDLGRAFRLTFADPLESYDFSNVVFIAGKDTMTGAPFKPLDSIRRQFFLDHEFEENSRYVLIIPDSSLFDMYGLTNDSIKIYFSTREYRDYGNLFISLDLESGDFSYIVQLLNTKEEILQTRYVQSSAQISFELIKPGKYLMKAIQDIHWNRQWDTGEYLEKKQPENVFYFPAEIEVRANWDISENWSLP